jgi:hypothetical protein
MIIFCDHIKLNSVSGKKVVICIQFKFSARSLKLSLHRYLNHDQSRYAWMLVVICVLVGEVQARVS